MSKNKVKSICNYIENQIAKIIKYIYDKKFIISIFIIIFILLAFQHSVITMYFDDYGNASLSYSYLVKNVAGTNYNFSQLLTWADKIYNNWGGRIFYAIAFIIPLLKNSIKPFMLVQTFVITSIIFYIYKIIKYYSKKSKLIDIVPILILILYTCIDMVYLRHGIYWASASVLYIWPLLPLFATIYFYIIIIEKIQKNKKRHSIIDILIIIILSFLTTFSQEQIGIALLGFFVTYIILHHAKEAKKYLFIDLPAVLTTIISYLLLFLAPGNWARMDTTSFSKLSFIDKILTNYPDILKNIFLDKMHIYIYVICLGIIFMIYKIFIKYYMKTKKIYFLIVPLMINIIEIILIHYNHILYNQTIFLIISTLWLISFLVVSILYFNMENKIEFISIEIAAACSIFCLLLSPTLGGRTGLPFIFFMFLISIKLLLDILNNNEKVIKIIAMLFIIILAKRGLYNYINIYDGYRDNYSISKLNDQILRDYDKNEDKNTIILYKVENSWYGSTQSYEEPTMDFWIKEYYDIPQTVKFKWEDIYERFR